MGTFSNTFSNTFSRGKSRQVVILEQIPNGTYLVSLEDDFLTDLLDENILLTEIEEEI